MNKEFDLSIHIVPELGTNEILRREFYEQLSLRIVLTKEDSKTPSRPVFVIFRPQGRAKDEFEDVAGKYIERHYSGRQKDIFFFTAFSGTKSSELDLGDGMSRFKFTTSITLVNKSLDVPTNRSIFDDASSVLISDYGYTPRSKDAAYDQSFAVSQGGVITTPSRKGCIAPSEKDQQTEPATPGGTDYSQRETEMDTTLKTSDEEPVCSGITSRKEENRSMDQYGFTNKHSYEEPDRNAENATPQRFQIEEPVCSGITSRKEENRSMDQQPDRNAENATPQRFQIEVHKNRNSFSDEEKKTRRKTIYTSVLKEHQMHMNKGPYPLQDKIENELKIPSGVLLRFLNTFLEELQKEQSSISHQQEEIPLVPDRVLANVRRKLFGFKLENDTLQKALAALQDGDLQKTISPAEEVLPSEVEESSEKIPEPDELMNIEHAVNDPSKLKEKQTRGRPPSPKMKNTASFSGNQDIPVNSNGPFSMSKETASVVDFKSSFETQVPSQWTSVTATEELTLESSKLLTTNAQFQVASSKMKRESNEYIHNEVLALKEQSEILENKKIEADILKIKLQLQELEKENMQMESNILNNNFQLQKKEMENKKMKFNILEKKLELQEQEKKNMQMESETLKNKLELQEQEKKNMQKEYETLKNKLELQEQEKKNMQMESETLKNKLELQEQEKNNMQMVSETMKNKLKLQEEEHEN